MSVRDRIVEHLKAHDEGVDDDMLTEALGLSRRQHANQECRKLESAGLVERRRVSGKIRNFATGTARACSEEVTESPPTVSVTSSQQFFRNPDKPWYWEGNVQSVVAQFLTGKGYTIRRVANTLTKEQGKDIIAVSSTGQELWVSVKGRPGRTPRTTPYLMARHYLSHAMRDMLVWRDENESVDLALGLPEFITYRNGVRTMAGRFADLTVSVIWVFEDAKVEVCPTFL